jgi:hypothetical protein
MYTGSMIGSGPVVFAVWGYVIAHARNGQVELNPALVGHLLGCSEDDVVSAVTFLSAPDPRSRNRNLEGRRLVRESEYGYAVPSHQHYQGIRDEDDRREYMRKYMKAYRGAAKTNADNSLGPRKQISKPRKPPLAQSEAESDTEASVSGKPVLEQGQGPAFVTLARDAFTLRRRVAEIVPWVDSALVAALTAVEADTHNRRARDNLHTAVIALAFAYAMKRWGHEGVLLDEKREKQMRSRLRENGDVLASGSELLYAADGALKDRMISGQDDKARKGGWLQVQTVYRDREQVERLARLGGYRPGKVHRMLTQHGLTKPPQGDASQ